MIMTICEMLNLRYQWETLAADFKLDTYDGTIQNLKMFIKEGHKNNRFREGFDEAVTIAEAIVKNYKI